MKKIIYLFLAVLVPGMSAQANAFNSLDCQASLFSEQAGGLEAQEALVIGESGDVRKQIKSYSFSVR